MGALTLAIDGTAKVVLGGGGGGGRRSSSRCTGDEILLWCGRDQRSRTSSRSGATIEPKKVVLVVIPGEVTIEKVLEDLGRHLLVVLGVAVGLVRRYLDRGATPLRAQGSHLGHAGEARVASPLVGHVHAVVNFDGLTSCERSVVVQGEGPVLANQGSLLSGTISRDEVVELVENSATLGAHPPSILERPAHDDAADLLAGGHLLQMGQQVVVMRMRSLCCRCRRCCCRRRGARRSLLGKKDGIERPSGRHAGAAVGMRRDGDADPISVDVQGHDSPGAQSCLPVHQGRNS